MKPFGLVVQLKGTGATGTVAMDALPDGPYRVEAGGYAAAGGGAALRGGRADRGGDRRHERGAGAGGAGAGAAAGLRGHGSASVRGAGGLGHIRSPGGSAYRSWSWGRGRLKTTPLLVSGRSSGSSPQVPGAHVAREHLPREHAVVVVAPRAARQLVVEEVRDDERGRVAAGGR